MTAPVEVIHALETLTAAAPHAAIVARAYIDELSAQIIRQSNAVKEQQVFGAGLAQEIREDLQAKLRLKDDEISNWRTKYHRLTERIAEQGRHAIQNSGLAPDQRERLLDKLKLFLASI